MILAKKAYWSGWRLVGLSLFFISTTSLLGWYQGNTIGFFDIYRPLEGIFGKSSTFIFLLILFFVSLYLTLRIAYWRVFTKIQEITPSFSDITGAIIPPEPKESKETPRKPEKVSAAMQRKLDKIQEKIDKNKGIQPRKPASQPSKIKKIFAKKDRSNALEEKKIPVYDTKGNLVSKKKKNENTSSILPDF